MIATARVSPYLSQGMTATVRVSLCLSMCMTATSRVSLSQPGTSQPWPPSRNTTQFFIVAWELTVVESSGKWSDPFTLPHSPGSGVKWEGGRNISQRTWDAWSTEVLTILKYWQYWSTDNTIYNKNRCSLFSSKLTFQQQLLLEILLSDFLISVYFFQCFFFLYVFSCNFFSKW